MVDLDAETAGRADAAPGHRAGAGAGEEGWPASSVLLLRHAGFAVERCTTTEDLRLAAGRVGVTLVLRRSAAPARAGAHALGGFDPPPLRGYRVVALVAGDSTAAQSAGADRVIALPFDPGSFTADMVDLVS